MTDPRTVIREKVAEALQREDHTAMVPRAQIERMADAAIAAHLEALDEAARIETVADLDALPVATVVIDAAHRLFECRRDTGYWYTPCDYYQFISDELHLPARVLYRPEEA